MKKVVGLIVFMAAAFLFVGCFEREETASPPTAPAKRLTNAEVAAGTSTEYGLITSKIYKDNLGIGAGEATTYEVLNTNSDVDTDLTDGATASTVPAAAAVTGLIDTTQKLEDASSAGAYASDILDCTDQAALVTLVSGVSPTNVTPVDTGNENTTFYLLMTDGRTDTQAVETDLEFPYNPSTDTLTVKNIAIASGGGITNVGVISPDGVLPRVLDGAELGDTATPHVMTAAEVSGNIITNNGASADAVFTFPALSTIEGSTGIFNVEEAYQVDLEPNGSEQFYLNGAQMGTGEHIQNTADTIGDMISWICTETACFFKSGNPNWVEATP